MKQFFVLGAFIALAFLPESVKAQLQPFTAFTKQDLKDDFQYVVDLLKRQHPNPYKFEDSIAFNRKFDSLMNRIDNDTNIASAIRYSPLQLLHDVHLKLEFKEEHIIELFYAINHFPLALTNFENRIIVNSMGGSIPFGAEILSINKMPVQTILNELNYATYSDGYIETGADRAGQNLSLFVSLIFPEATAYDVEYKVYGTTSSKKTCIHPVDAKTAYHARNHGQLPFNSFLRRAYVTKEYLQHESAAILTVQTFMLAENTFYKELTDFFGEVDKKNIGNIIIDIRSNGGGNPNMSALLYSFIALKPFDNVFNYRTKNIEIHGAENILNNHGSNMSEEEVAQTGNFLKQRFDYDSATQFFYGNARLTEGSIANYPPDKNNFKGNVYVLTSGGTVSAATYFAALVKKNDRGLIVGSETGSGESSTTAAWFHTYSLPKTKARLTVPMSEVYFMNSTEDNGRGCLPDKQFTFEQFQKYIHAGKDPGIEFVLDLISGKK